MNGMDVGSPQYRELTYVYVFFQDVLKFFAFLMIMLLAFLIALQNLFSYYSFEHRTRTEALAPNKSNPVSATKYFGK
jgi:hypothetical protein